MPSPTYQEIPLTFEKGLVLETEESVLGEGMASALYNWTPEHTGGLRARNRWRAISETGLTDTTYNVRGWGSIGVSAAPAVIQSVSNNDNTTTKPLALYGVQAGSVMVILLITPDASDDALATGMTGYTSQGTASGSIRVFTKVSSGGTETATPSFTNTSTNKYAFMLEVVNIDATADDSDSATGTTSLSIAVTSTPTTSSSFVILGRSAANVASGANTRPNMDVALISSNENATGTNPYSLGYVTSNVLGNQTFTWTTADAPTQNRALAVAFKATNRSSRSFYVVMANAVTDAKLSSALSGTAYITETSTITDQSTYNSGAGSSPSASGAVLFCLVGNRKATTPDTPTVTGTNAYSGTWTQVATKLTDGGTRRLTVFTSTAQSTTSGVATAAFGGATQLSGNVILFEMSASEIDAVTPTVQAVTGSGTGTSMTATLAAFADSVNIPALFVLTAASAANALAPTEDLTEVRDGQINAEGLQLGAYVGYDSANLTPAVNGATSLEWAAIAVELDTLHSGVGYRIWQIPKDELDAGTWTSIDEVADVSDSSSLVAFAQGAGALIYTSDTMPYPRHIVLASGVATDVTSVGSAGRAVCYHKNRFFMTGSSTNPARVYFSDLADGTTWGVNSYFDLNADDGETAEDMVSVEGLLLVAKTNQTFLISGSGIESFFVNSLSGGSSATGRSLAKTPYGTILSGTYEMWSVQGGGIDPLSRPLGSGYSIAGYVSSAYASDKAYTLDSGTGIIYVQDLVTGAFALENVTHTDTPHVLFAVGRTLIYGCDSASTYLGGYRSIADTRVGDAPATTTEYDASTGLTFLMGPQVKYTPRHLFLQMRRQGATPANLTVTVETPAGTRNWTVAPTSTVTRERLDIGYASGQPWIQIHFSQSCTPGQNPCDVERIVLGVDVERIR